MATDAVPFDVLRTLLDELKLRFQAANNPGSPRKAWLLHIPDKGRPPKECVLLDGYPDVGYLRLKPIIEDAARLLDRLPGAVHTRLWGCPTPEIPVQLMSDSDRIPHWVTAVFLLLNASGVGPPLRRVQELPLDEKPIGFKFHPAVEWYATLLDFAAASVQAIAILQGWLDEQPKQTAEVDGQGGKGSAAGKKATAGHKDKTRKAARAAVLVEQTVRNYHKFDGGIVDETIPAISGRDLAKLAGNAFHARSADRWFVERFGSKEAYQAACLNGTLGRLLAVKADDVRSFGVFDHTANDVSDDQDDDDDTEHEPAKAKRGKRKPRIKQHF